MKIYLIRHGDAEHPSALKKDFERELTAAGVEKLKKTVLGWKNYIKHFDLLITSPYKRALQTTQVIADIYGMKDKIVVEDRIACGARTEDILNIANSMGVEKIAFIGHEPDLSNHVINLTSGNEFNIEFKKGMIAKVAFAGKARFSRGVLQYLIPSELFSA